MNAITMADPARLSSGKPICLAILAMGGQGGGVLSDWIVSVAEAQGWAAQSTSVPGVAQRTGATIYYIEMLPWSQGKRPIFSLMPTPGDVDVVLSAEFMEAGRAMLRGIVTPDRTTLITSNHRSFAVVEKTAPGDGEGDSGAVVEALGVAAKRVISFDMQSLAEKSGSVISATMLGALAAAEVLPFPKEAFEAAIRAGGKGVEPSVKAFAAAYEQTARKEPPQAPKALEKALPPPPASVGHPELDRLLSRLAKNLPQSVQPMAFAGVKRLVDYQDTAYADAYLARLEQIVTEDANKGGEAKNFVFSQEAAKYLATAMAYDDVIRVADLKTRSSRFARVRQELGVRDDQILYTTEYMHPRMEEVVGTLPVNLAAFFERHPKLSALLDRVVNRGRRVKTGTLFWFLPLYALAHAKPLRLKSLRHRQEMAHIDAWLASALQHLPASYDLACEILRCRRLIKGYSDTHARGASKFDRVLAMVPKLSAVPDGADWLRRLRQAALADEKGDALDGAIKTFESAHTT